jgi:hypothetical protein
MSKRESKRIANQIEINLLKEQKNIWAMNRVPETKRQLEFESQVEVERLINLQYQCDLDLDSGSKCRQRFRSFLEQQEHQIAAHGAKRTAEVTETFEERVV